jgi:hypothetical protein
MVQAAVHHDPVQATIQNQRQPESVFARNISSDIWILKRGK